MHSRKTKRSLNWVSQGKKISYRPAIFKLCLPLVAVPRGDFVSRLGVLPAVRRGAHCFLCPQGESGEETSPVSPLALPDLRAGQRTSVCSTGSEDTTPSPISRQLSGSKCARVNCEKMEINDVAVHSGRAKPSIFFNPSIVNTSSCTQACVA